MKVTVMHNPHRTDIPKHLHIESHSGSAIRRTGMTLVRCIGDIYSASITVYSMSDTRYLFILQRSLVAVMLFSFGVYS